MPSSSALPTPPRGVWTLLLPLLLLITGCAEEEADPDGPAAERIVSLVPAATSTFEVLGETRRLVGRTDFDTAGSVAHLPSVGRGLRPDLERLLTLEPDLVVVFEGESDPRTRERLRAAGVTVIAVRPDDVHDVLDMIRTLGRVAGRGSRADALADSLTRRIDGVRERVAGRPPRPVAFLVGGSPPWVAGPGTFLDQLLDAAGGENVFGDLDRLYGAVSTEALVAREPELLLLPEGAPAPETTGGVPLVRVPVWVMRPGPSLARAADTLARILHPEVFP